MSRRLRKNTAGRLHGRRGGHAASDQVLSCYIFEFQLNSHFNTYRPILGHVCTAFRQMRNTDFSPDFLGGYCLSRGASIVRTQYRSEHCFGVWYQSGCTPPFHFMQDSWIGRNKNIHWPVTSLDVEPPDFFVLVFKRKRV
jgi:hypothetical protein